MRAVSPQEQARKSFLRKTVRKFGTFGSVALLTVASDLLSVAAVYTLRLSIVGSVKPADLIVGLIIPTVLVPITSVFYIFLIRDLDEAETELDKALQIAAKAQAIARTAAVGTMAAGIAHEINNPLAIITGKTEVANLLQSRRLMTPEKFAEFHSAVVEACERIGHIIAGMQTMALVDSIDEQVNFSKVVEQTTKFFLGRARLQSAELLSETALDGVTHTDVYVNGANLMQALTSLIGNALDAVEGQPGAWVKIRVEGDSRFARVRVLNSGPLIPENIRRHLMEPFFSTKPIGKGIGLGLSISRSMVEAMKGELFLDESVDNTCFVIQIPWHTATAAA